MSSAVRFMPEGYGPSACTLVKFFLRTVGLEAVLPAVVDLDEGEAERFEILGGEGGLGGQILFTRSVGMIPGAVTDGLRLEFHLIDLGDGVGPGFESQAASSKEPMAKVSSVSVWLGLMRSFP